MHIVYFTFNKTKTITKREVYLPDRSTKHKFLTILYICETKYVLLDSNVNHHTKIAVNQPINRYRHHKINIKKNLAPELVVKWVVSFKLRLYSLPGDCLSQSCRRNTENQTAIWKVSSITDRHRFGDPLSILWIFMVLISHFNHVFNTENDHILSHLLKFIIHNHYHFRSYLT